MSAPPPSRLTPGAAQRVTDRFRAIGYTVDGVAQALGLSVNAAFGRGDLAGVERATRDPDHLGALVRLFLLGLDVPLEQVSAALTPAVLGALRRGGIVDVTESGVARAALDIRPYAETADPVTGASSSDPGWWVVSDFGSELRALRSDHVLGIGSAATTLAQAVVRSPVDRALDLGTGCGVQALHLSRHARHVVATDLSRRALGLAATTAALNGESWDLREGDLLAPVRGDGFDLIVSNPPFVIGPGSAEFDYRDSGREGDGVSSELVTGMPRLLNPGGTAQLLANWTVTAGEPWDERVAGWLVDTGCDAWIWQRDTADPAEYVAMWLRDAGTTPGTEPYREAYDSWLGWFETKGVLGVGLGLVNLRRAGSEHPQVVCESVPQALEQPVAPAIASWWSRLDWLRARSDDRLLSSILAPAPDLVLSSDAISTTTGWRTERSRLRAGGGMRWEVETDDAVAVLVAGLGAGTSVETALSLLAASVDVPVELLRSAVLPVLRDLVQRGLLLPTSAA